MSGVLVDSHPVPFDCKPCKGTGTMGDSWCMECGGIGCDWFDRAPLFILAQNLAIGAALCEAFDRGHNWIDEADFYTGHAIAATSGGEGG